LQGNQVAPYAGGPRHDLNHSDPACLHGQDRPVRFFFESGNKPCFSKPERRGIYDWVMDYGVERILIDNEAVPGKLRRELGPGDCRGIWRSIQSLSGTENAKEKNITETGEERVG